VVTITSFNNFKIIIIRKILHSQVSLNPFYVMLESPRTMSFWDAFKDYSNQPFRQNRDNYVFIFSPFFF
jgi:hypothetical protein